MFKSLAISEIEQIIYLTLDDIEWSKQGHDW